MNGEHTKPVVPVSEKQFYRVELSVTPEAPCECGHNTLWTITYDDGEPTEIGSAWEGPEGKELAEDICDLMNMAFDRGQKSQIDNAEEAKLVAFFRSPDGEALGRDGDDDGLSPAATAIRAMRDLRRQLNNALNELTVRALNG